MIPSSDRAGTAAFRATMALLATGVTVVSARDPASGRPHGMTANAVMSVSLAPPLIVVSVRRTARLHAAVLQAGAYAVTVLAETQWQLARRFAGHDQNAEPQFSERSGVPVLRHGLAWIVARLHDAHPAGDHTLFIGEATECGPDRAADPPLAYHRSAFAGLAPLGSEGHGTMLRAWETGLDLWG
jgi:flavin reductase (DIM6/NTAB) family NADH-FMN oxidoreductase RutF